MRLRPLVRHWTRDTGMFRIIFLTLVAKALADSSSSQGHVKYSDASGSSVDWKLYAPYSQFKSQLAVRNQRRNGVKSSSEQPRTIRPVESPVGVAAKSVEPRYKPFSQVPHHLKQLLTQSYEPQLPHVDHDAFFHQVPRYSWGEVIHPKSQSMDYESKTQSTMTRAQDRREEPKLNFGEKEEEVHNQPGRNEVPAPPLVSRRPLESFNFDKSVPIEIRQLLHYQAQIPYNVIANHIVHTPITPFVPEPLPNDETGPYQYRSKIYYAVEGDAKTNNIQKNPATQDPNNYE